MSSGGEERTYYLRVPAGYDPSVPMVLIIGLHGTGGSSDAFLEDTYYNLQGAVGDEAILVYPNALPGTGGLPQWNYELDTPFFDDLLDDLDK